MAKRKRLTVPSPTASPASEGAVPPSSKGVAMPFESTPFEDTPDRSRRAPIADVAGDAATVSALEQVASELHNARAEGRMIQALPLDIVSPSHLIRDRMVLDTEDMEALKTSLRARGQQTPIEVTQTSRGQYGLISGYRRLQALKDIRTEDPTATDTVLALIRQPDDASDAYIAMVEENEIRASLSYYERASIVTASVREGVFPTDTAALQGLFASASRSKRSKIKSFLPLVQHLGGALLFPTALTERFGLALAARCVADSDFVSRLKDRLRKANPESAAEELALITKALDGGVAENPSDAPAVIQPESQILTGKSAPSQTVAEWSATPRSDVVMTLKQGKLILSGSGVTEAMAEHLAAVLGAK